MFETSCFLAQSFIWIYPSIFQFAEDGEGEFRVVPSMQELLKALAKPLDIRTKWEVKKIVWPGENGENKESNGRCSD